MEEASALDLIPENGKVTTFFETTEQVYEEGDLVARVVRHYIFRNGLEVKIVQG